ncbi:hypothetical protein [Catenulispora pinisilvae]|uniref:hypothetical protein n=1 Tax=Catenulispora pinisilvae TaxID=2705253 RepID=UPI001890FADE|nr:hypothetical protein [Catenulispora pinisilvae]
MDMLRTTDPIMWQGAWFQIDTVHTSDEAAPWFTGFWEPPGRSTPDARVAVRLRLTYEGPDRISVLLTADDEHTYGQRHQLASWYALSTASWTAAVAPTVTAHPWAAHTHHWTEHNKGGNKILRAALAYILTSR